MSREYLEILHDTANTGQDGSQKLTLKGSDAASEYLVRAMIERVVEIGDDNVEKQIETTRDWMDNLAETDYLPLQTYVLKKFADARENSKK